MIKGRVQYSTVQYSARTHVRTALWDVQSSIWIKMNLKNKNSSSDNNESEKVRYQDWDENISVYDVNAVSHQTYSINW